MVLVLKIYGKTHINTSPSELKIFPVKVDLKIRQESGQIVGRQIVQSSMYFNVNYSVAVTLTFTWLLGIRKLIKSNPD